MFVFRSNALRAAVLAISMVVWIAMPSQAAATSLHSEVASTTLEGSQATQVVFKTPSGEVKCTSVTIKGTMSAATVESTTFTGTNSGCTAFGFATTHTTDNCNLQSTWIWPFNTTHRICGPGQKHAITPTVLGASACTIEMGSQTFAGKVDGKNEGSGSSRDVLLTFTLEKISYTSSGGACGSAGAHTDGTLTGSITLKGSSGGKQVGIWGE